MQKFIIVLFCLIISFNLNITVILLESADSGKDVNFDYDDDILIQTRVKHGKIATNTYPFLASIKVGGENLCGGSLIKPQWVLTAAHCLQRVKKPKETEIYFNSTRLYKGIPATAAKHIPHEKYNPARDLTHYDIGLIKLNSPVESGEAEPILIPTEGDEKTSYANKMALVLGWGRTEDVGITSKLREGHVTLIDNKNCRRQAISNHQICANVDPNQPIACHGDSGGPMVIKNEDNEWLQIGVISYGAPIVNRTHCHSYDLYTKVAVYRKWIQDTIDKNT